MLKRFAVSLAISSVFSSVAVADGVAATDAEVGKGSHSGHRREVVRKPVSPLDDADKRSSIEQDILRVRSALTAVSHSLSSGARVAVFPYRHNKIYQVDIKPGMFTTFTFPRDEVIRQFAVTNPDAADVSVNADANAAMLRLNADVAMSATIVTDKRAYYLTITPASDAWHQGVSWSYDEESVSGFGYRAKSSPPGSSRAGLADAGIPEQEDALSGHPNFDYQIEGDASVSPVAVWDNGRFTWIQFNNSVQSLPAVFYLGPDGPEVVNYTVAPGGRQIKINRLMDRILLRLGSQKATVTAR